MKENLGNWDLVASALADVAIEHRPSVRTTIAGIHAFLMALQATGHADASQIAEELSQMADYYRSLVWKQ
jgi:hypothetical protein